MPAQERERPDRDGLSLVAKASAVRAMEQQPVSSFQGDTVGAGDRFSEAAEDER
jgi:hypothetical protein